MRDVLFVGMPQLVDAGTFDAKLTHTRHKGDIFLSGELSEFTEPNDLACGWTSRFRNCREWCRRLSERFQVAGVTMAEWNSAFGPELGVLGDWPNGTQWPALIATVPVKDSAKAGQLFAKMTTAPDGTSLAREENGVRFFTARDGRDAILDYADNCVVGQASRRRHDGRRRGRGDKTKFECCFGVSVFGNISRGRARRAVG